MFYTEEMAKTKTTANAKHTVGQAANAAKNAARAVAKAVEEIKSLALRNASEIANTAAAEAEAISSKFDRMMSKSQAMQDFARAVYTVVAATRSVAESLASPETKSNLNRLAHEAETLADRVADLAYVTDLTAEAEKETKEETDRLKETLKEELKKIAKGKVDDAIKVAQEARDEKNEEEAKIDANEKKEAQEKNEEVDIGEIKEEGAKIDESKEAKKPEKPEKAKKHKGETEGQEVEKKAEKPKKTEGPKRKKATENTEDAQATESKKGAKKKKNAKKTESDNHISQEGKDRFRRARKEDEYVNETANTRRIYKNDKNKTKKENILSSIRFYQNDLGSDTLLKKRGFYWLAKQISNDIHGDYLRFTEDSLEVLRALTESAIINLLVNSKNLAEHARMDTRMNEGEQFVKLLDKDIHLAYQINTGKEYKTYKALIN